MNTLHVEKNGRKNDDLTVIKGIGPSRQKWLHEVAGVHTLLGLAALTVEELEARVGPDGLIVSRNEIARWIEQACDLTADAETTSPDNPHPKSQQSGNWESFALIMVWFEKRTLETGEIELQTKFHHFDKDKEVVWPGIEVDKLKDWILEQIMHEEAHIEEAEPVAVPQIEEAEPTPVVTEQATTHTRTPKGISELTRIQPTEVRIYQPAGAQSPQGTGIAGESIATVLQSSETLALEVAFELTGDCAGDTASPDTHYSATFYARNRTSGEEFLLGNTDTYAMHSKQLTYAARLTDTRLDAGVYRLRGVIKVNNAVSLFGYVEVPLLRVY